MTEKKDPYGARTSIRVAAFFLGLLMLACGFSYLYERLTINPDLGGDLPPDILWILFGTFSMIVAIRGRWFGKKEY
jgi:hypothetical protein